MVLRILSVIALLLVGVWLLVFFRKNPGSWRACKAWFAGECKSAFGKEWLRHWKRTVYYILLLVVAIQALTGFIPFLVLGKPLGGFALMLHVALAPVFAVLAAAFVLGRADAHTFDKKSVEFLSAVAAKKENISALADQFYAKFFFWFVIISAVIVASMVFSMYPIFGTIGQEKLLNIHRGASVALFVFIILFTLRTVRLQADKQD